MMIEKNYPLFKRTHLAKWLVNDMIKFKGCRISVINSMNLHLSIGIMTGGNMPEDQNGGDNCQRPKFKTKSNQNILYRLINVVSVFSYTQTSACQSIYYIHILFQSTSS